MVIFQQSDCIDWIIFLLYTVTDQLFWYLIHVVQRDVKNGKELEDTIENDQNDFRQFDSCFELFLYCRINTIYVYCRTISDVFALATKTGQNISPEAHIYILVLKLVQINVIFSDNVRIPDRPTATLVMLNECSQLAHVYSSIHQRLQTHN